MNPSNFHKRIILILVFALFLLGIPLLQSLFFSATSHGKIVIEKKISAPFLNAVEKPFILMIFGYVGCTDVCTPLLMHLNELYQSPLMTQYKENLDVVFVNLTPEINSNQPELFAKVFNPYFQGIYLTQRNIMTIERDFLLFHSRRLDNVAELNHSDNLYLLSRDLNNSLILHTVYATHPLNKKELIDDIIRLMEQH